MPLPRRTVVQWGDRLEEALLSKLPARVSTFDAPPYLVAIEGMPATGKTAIAALVASALGATLVRPTRALRRPRGDARSREATHLAGLADVFAASQAAADALARGAPAVVDGYFLGGEASAQLEGSRLQLDHLAAHLEPADVTIFLDAPREVTRARLSSRDPRARLDANGEARLRELHLARRSLPVVGRFVHVDASRLDTADLASRIVEEVAALVLGAS